MIKPGEEVGNYRILKPLGEGGMGMVFVAEHIRLERKVALKVLRAEYSSRPDSVARFLNEARAVNRIGHEHIVEVTDDGVAPSGENYFVMELLSGESLGDRLKRAGPMALDQALNVVVQMADALAASHAVGIVHRDLKPDNVFLIKRSGHADYVKLLDFGIAKLLDAENAHSNTKSGSLLGTPYYMSPEQCRGRQREIDSRTDIYSLGILLYQILVGTVPFKSEGWGEILVMHLSDPFPSIREQLPDLPVEVETVLNKAVAKAREDRWQSMEQFRDALIELQDAFAPAPVRRTGPSSESASGGGSLNVSSAGAASRGGADSAARRSEAGRSAAVAGHSSSPRPAAAPVVAARPSTLSIAVGESVVAGPRRSRALLGTAATMIILVAVGVGVLVTRQGGPDDDKAAGATATKVRSPARAAGVKPAAAPAPADPVEAAPAPAVEAAPAPAVEPAQAASAAADAGVAAAAVGAESDAGSANAAAPSPSLPRIKISKAPKGPPPARLARPPRASGQQPVARPSVVKPPASAEPAAGSKPLPADVRKQLVLPPE